MNIKAVIVAFMSLLAVGCESTGRTSSQESSNDDGVSVFLDTEHTRLKSKDTNITGYTYIKNNRRHIDLYNNLTVVDQLCTAIYKPKNMPTPVALDIIEEYFLTGRYPHPDVRGTKALIFRKGSGRNGYSYKFVALPGLRDQGYSCIMYNSDVIRSKEFYNYSYVFIKGYRYVRYYNGEDFDQSCDFIHKNNVVKRRVVIPSKTWSEDLYVEEGFPKATCSLNLYR